MQNRESNLNFMSNFPGDNQIPKMTPIGQGKLLNIFHFNSCLNQVLLIKLKINL